MKKIISIQGMSCANCAQKIEKKIQLIAGVKQAQVNFASENLVVEIENSQVLSTIYYEIDKLGYQAIEDSVLSIFEIKGMSCANCGLRIEKAIAQLTGVEQAQVNSATEKLYVTHSKKLSPQIISQTVEELGYQVLLMDNKQEEKEDPLQKRVIWSVVFTLPLLYLAMGHMFGLPLPHLLHQSLVMWVAQFILVVPILWINRQYYYRGFRYLWERQPNMDSLVALGTGAAFLQGVVALFFIGQGQQQDLYFETTGVILTLITLGKYLEHGAKKQTTRAIQTLLDLSPKTATVVTEIGEKIVPIEFVKVGDVLLSKAGEQIALDGTIEKGSAQIDESMLTGESMPISKNVGDKVVGATLNTNGAIYYRVEHTGKDTVLAQIVQLIQEAQGSRAPIAKLADKISRIFVPIVLFLAVATLFVWLMLGQIEIAWQTFIAILVIACPCALGLATPTAIMVATGKGAQQGILIKQGESLERMQQIDTLILDKTGTITEGTPVVTDWVMDMPESELFQLIGSLESLSAHPLAKAIVKKAKDYTTAFDSVEDFQIHEGRGITGRVNGYELALGNQDLISQASQMYVDLAEKFAMQQKTPIFIAVNGQVVGLLGIADKIKETSRQAILQLQQVGIDIIMVTGDNKKTAKVIAKEVGIKTIFAEHSPQDKARVIAQLQEQGKVVAMVGDGINDAPALVKADVGLAIGSGTDVAIESADIVLIHSDLMDVVKTYYLSKGTLKTIKENLFFAFIYNIIGIPIAMGVFYYPFGWLLNPMVAGLAMSMSSISVVLNALRLNKIVLENKK